MPESFNVLVKELQGLSLKVELVDSEGSIEDAEELLVENVNLVGSSASTVALPTDDLPLDVTADDAVNTDFVVVEDDETQVTATDEELAELDITNEQDMEAENV